MVVSVGYDAVLRSFRVGLAHARLSALDLSTAPDQPMLPVHGNDAMVSNGEIYDDLEQRTQLRARGGRFRTIGDIEVLLHRDSYEKKNLFSHHAGEQLIAASEGKALFPIPGGRRTLRLRSGVPIGIAVSGGVACAPCPAIAPPLGRKTSTARGATRLRST